MVEWHIITCEYPPQIGGVGDYTHLVAAELAAAGDKVHVWCPPVEGAVQAPGVVLHPEFGSFGAKDLDRVDRMLDAFGPSLRLLVQWVPHGYGKRAMNVGFCRWIERRARKKADTVELMVHEPYLGFATRSWKHWVIAAVNRLMVVLLLRAASRIWMATPIWERCLRPYTLRRDVPFHWLPIPSNVPVVEDEAAVARVRDRYAPEGRKLLGHFGTYGGYTREVLQELLPELLRSTDRAMLLLGSGSDAFRAELVWRLPELATRLHATGALDPISLSHHLRACDVMLQPYPDGVSTRRGSLFAPLAHGVPLVTTTGVATEPLWAETGAVALAPVRELPQLRALAEKLLSNPAERERLGLAAETLYRERFAVRHTADTLRSAAAAGAQLTLTP